MQSQNQTADDDSVVDLVKDYSNPKSLVSVTPSAVAKRIEAIPDDIFLLNNEALEEKARPFDTERKLRSAFQMEYERAIRTSETMEMTSVYKGIVTGSYFNKYIVGNSFKLAYIIKPYSEYKAELEDMLQLSLDEMRKILKQPLVSNSGIFDTRLAGMKHKIFTDLADRTRGSATKRLEIDSKSMNLNINQEVPAKSIEEIDRKLSELQAKEVQQISYKDDSNAEEI